MNDLDLIGMEKQAAVDSLKNEGVQVRIEAEDGEHFMLTMDYRPDRRNLTISDGKVIGVRRG